MRRISVTLTMGMALFLSAGSSLRAEDAVITQTGDRCCQPAPVIVECAPPTCKICVSIPKENFKVEHTSVCHDYCIPHCSLRNILSGRGCDCQNGCGECGKVHTRHVLVKRWVRTCDTTQCVVSEAPSTPCGTLPPAPMPSGSKSETIPVKPTPAK